MASESIVHLADSEPIRARGTIVEYLSFPFDEICQRYHKVLLSKAVLKVTESLIDWLAEV